MSNIVVIKRAERRTPPPPPVGDLVLEEPPEIPEVTNQGFQQALMYLPMIAMAAAMGLMMTAGMGMGGRSPIMYAAGGLMVIGMGGMMLGSMGRTAGQRKIKLNGARRDYFRYLTQARRRVRKIARQQREALEWTGPEPHTLWSLVMTDRLWERRPRDKDFGHTRLGLGTQQLAVSIVPPETKPVEDLDPVSAGALRRFVRTHGTVPALPVSVSLASFARIYPRGDAAAVRGLVRAMIGQIAAFHSPDDMRIALCASPDRIADWDWLKWLPHSLHPSQFDAAGPVRLAHPDLGQIDKLLATELQDRARFTQGMQADVLPYIVVIVDGGQVGPDSSIGADGIEGVTVIDLDGHVTPSMQKTVLRLDVQPEKIAIVREDRTGQEVRSNLGRPDSLDVPQAEGLARQLTPLRASESAATSEDALAANLGLTDLLGVGDPATIDVRQTWRARAPRNRLRVPIGVNSDGRPIELDIKESAQGGMGPHGLIIGATGSGKSELLRTLVLGLAITHSSEVLNYVLVDFKGGATFLGLDSLPHVSAVITNLEDELPLVDRMYDALHGEMVRRQELLRATGNYASLRDYEKAREQGADLKPLPTLFVVLDEFSELLSAKPQFAELFVMIGRLGRSLGVHLLLASQRLEEGKLRGLDTHLSYRVGLRTFSSSESRTVLGVPDAYELPSAPGNGYLKFDTTGMTRFKAAYVSGAYEQSSAAPDPVASGSAPQQIVWYGLGRAPMPGQPGQEEAGKAVSAGPGSSTGPTLLDVAVSQLEAKGPAAHRIWLPPLDDPPALDELLPELTVSPGSGLATNGWEGRGRLHAVVGIIDRPFDQRRDPFWVDLSGAAGHVGVAGGPRSGKSTILRSLICALSLMHTPQEVQFYCLDFGGGAMAGLADLPHVGGVANRLDADRVRRTVAEMTTLLQQREALFVEHGIDSADAFRRARAEGRIHDGFGDVFLVVDNWLLLRQEFEELEPKVTDLAARGLGYGIHVVAATNKWSEFRMNIRDLFGTRLELKMGDPYDSELNRKLAANVPENSPGRGLTKEAKHYLTVLPRIDGKHTHEDLGDGMAHLVKSVMSAWKGPPAPPVRLLPASLPSSSLPTPADTGRKIPIGIDEAELAPVLLDFDTDPHLVVVGDNECGKSNLLRLIATSITERYTPREARMIFFDYRRSLLETAEGEYRIGYAASSTAAAELVKNTREALLKRLPPPDLTAEQLRERSWWKGSDLFLIIDDYELVAGMNNPLMPLIDLLPQARDIGMHLIIARSMGGAGRAMFDKVIQSLKDMASPALVMSGNKDEGALFGNIRPHALPVGRAYYVERKAGNRLIQTAVMAPGDA